MKGPLWFAGVSALALIAAVLAAGGETKPAACGFGLCFANGLAGWLIDRRTVGAKGERSVLISLMAHAARAMLLLIVLLAARPALGTGFRAFVAATLAGYFVFLFGEIARLARST